MRPSLPTYVVVAGYDYEGDDAIAATLDPVEALQIADDIASSEHFDKIEIRVMCPKIVKLWVRESPREAASRYRIYDENGVLRAETSYFRNEPPTSQRERLTLAAEALMALAASAKV
jgi:hypothetical protein